MSQRLSLLLDTNVLVAAFISGGGAPAQLIHAAETGVFRLVLSPLLIEEMTDVLARTKFRRYLSVDEASDMINHLTALAEVVSDPSPSGESITDDPDDDFLVVLAEAAGVTALVSGDPHLTKLRRPGLRTLTPRQALDLITPSAEQIQLPETV